MHIIRRRLEQNGLTQELQAAVLLREGRPPMRETWLRAPSQYDMCVELFRAFVPFLSLALGCEGMGWYATPPGSRCCVRVQRCKPPGVSARKSPVVLFRGCPWQHTAGFLWIFLCEFTHGTGYPGKTTGERCLPGSSLWMAPSPPWRGGFVLCDLHLYFPCDFFQLGIVPG